MAPANYGCSSDHANIRLDGSSSADTFKSLFLQDPAKTDLGLDGSSPTSSRKIVPPSAIQMRPSRR